MADANVPLVYVDTSVWLQSITGQEPHDMCDRVLLAGGAGRIQVVASWLVRAEVQSVPPPNTDRVLTEVVDQLLDSKGVRWVAVDRFVAVEARELSLRLPKRLSGADAVHLATAVLEKAAFFMTMDEDFPFDNTIDGVAVTKPMVVWQEDLFGLV